MANVTRLQTQPGITPPRESSGVKLVGAALRCRSCCHEWTGTLDAFSHVEPQSLRCPRCTAKTPPEAAQRKSA